MLKKLFTKSSAHPKNFRSKLLLAPLFIGMVLASLWLGLVLWFHLPDVLGLGQGKQTEMARWLAVCGLGGLSLTTLWARGMGWQSADKWLWGYGVLALVIGAGFFSFSPKQHRAWQAEVSHSVTYERDAQHPNLITLHHVRDFVWQRNLKLTDVPKLQDDTPKLHTKFHAEDKQFTSQASQTADKTELASIKKDTVVQERWISRTVNLNDLVGIDVINSYWMGRPIAHTLISFRFANAEPITFSFEIRKEEGEDFSTLGGFVRQFELALIASTERDIVYTRSNVRGEQVYVFPIAGVSQAEMQALFLQYLKQADKLQQEPTWYNTLTANCTNLIFNMARQVSAENQDGEKLPYDARIWASGYLPSYLKEQNLLPNRDLTIDEWMQKGWINPKVQNLTLEDVQADAGLYSKRMRDGISQPSP